LRREKPVALDAELIRLWFQIVLIDLTLAGDNALVIAMAVRTLAPREQFFGRFFGTFGAVALRLLFIAIVSMLLRIPLLQFAGGIVLIWIAVKLVGQAGEEEAGQVRHGTTLREAIGIIIVADAVMSFDNAVGIAAVAKDDLLVAALGIAISIPIVIWGSGILARLMGRFPWIIWLGAAVLGHVAGELIVKDPMIHDLAPALTDALHGPLPWALAVALFLLGWWYARRETVARTAEAA
jgi:YjbE family integral membrane protein